MIQTVGKRIEDFEGWKDEIGKGASATVYRVRSKVVGFENDRYYAIKKISLKPIKKQHSYSSWKKRIENEIRIHKMLTIKNCAVVQFHSAFEDEGFCHLVLEYCPGGSFDDFLKKYKEENMTERERKVGPLIVEAIQGVYKLHHNGVIHRDLSTKNILIAEDGIVKIADFGFAIEYDPEMIDKKIGFKKKVKTPCSVLGTPDFMAPEIGKRLESDRCKPYDDKVDVYSLGCVMFKMLFGYAYQKEEIPQGASKEAKELLKDMLKLDPRKRISIYDVLQYEFYKKYKCENILLKERYRQRSSDSGMNSLSGSRSSQKRRESFKQGKGEQKERENRSISRERGYNDNYSYKQYTHSSSGHGSARSWNQNDHNLEQQRAKSPCQPRQRSSHESDPMKPPPEGIGYPTYFPNSTEQKIGKFSHYNSAYSDYNGIDSNKICESSINKQGSLITRNHHSHKKVKKQDSELKNSKIDKGTHNKPERLTTDRLSPKRHTTKIAIFAVLNDDDVFKDYRNGVCAEFLIKNYVVEVLFVSRDGQKITIYKPKDKIVPSGEPPLLPDNTKEVEYFLECNYQELPKPHWKKYKHAKMFVDILKTRVAKVTIFRENATFVMMERTPDQVYQMDFHNADYRIIETGGIRSVTDKNGAKINENKLDGDFMNMFNKMKEECHQLEASLDDRYFPATLGRRPRALLKNADHNNENISQKNMFSSSGTINMKSFSGLSYSGYNAVFSPTTNSPTANIRSPSLSREITTAQKYITDVVPPLKYQPWIVNGSVVVEYEDGIHMSLSMTDENKVIFRNGIIGQSWTIQQRPDLRERYKRDQSYIRQFVSLHLKLTK